MADEETFAQWNKNFIHNQPTALEIRKFKIACRLNRIGMFSKAFAESVPVWSIKALAAFAPSSRNCFAHINGLSETILPIGGGYRMGRLEIIGVVNQIN